MFRSIITAGLAACALTLAACSTVMPPVSAQTDQVTADKITSVGSQIVAGVQTACGFVIEAEPAIAIAATFLGAPTVAGVVTTAVNGLCSLLGSKGVRRGGAVPRYRGVVVRYQRA